ncbi:MAG: metal ABC transporter substrate-binding protein [Campylobacterota bacterium]|nr:metal ABC transporter substrate-binding protein [Campylobacterota bacterium]
MKKAATLVVIILIVIMMFILFLDKEKKPIIEKPQITVSTFALYDISKSLLRDMANISMLVPFGQDIHSYEMTPQDRIGVEKSKFFIYSGAGLEPWTDSFKDHPHALDMSQFVNLRHVEDHHDHHNHNHSIDPHYWLDIDNMIILTNKLRDVYRAAFPQEFSRQINANALYYINGLRKLGELYKKRLSACKRDTIIVSHNAFGYLGDRYGFHVLGLMGLSPDAMPSAKDLARLSDLVHEKRVSVLFNEPYASDSLIQSVADEAGVRVDTLQPLANITEREATEMRDYKLMMQLNLRKLYYALECQ